MQNSPLGRSLLCLACAGWLAAAAAEEPESAPPLTEAQSEIQSAFDAATQAVTAGPAAIPLAGQATLRLPEGYGFIPEAQAGRLLESMGNRAGDGLQGLIVSAQGEEEAEWFVVVSYDDSGYIKDDDARDWNADELLSSIRKGTEQSNEERRSRGIPEIEVVGWVEKPQYEESTHRLVWSVASRAKGDASEGDDGINYNTLALGREGYFSLNLVTAAQDVEHLKPVARTLLASLDFDTGKRYADFNADTDKVAEYGLAALVAGVAAKKLGLFALAAAFIVKFAKVIGVAVVVGLGSLGKFFGKKDKPDSSGSA